MNVDGNRPNNHYTRYNPYFYNVDLKGSPLLNFPKMWKNAIKYHILQEMQSAQTYCERAWIMQTGLPGPFATEEFMQSCICDCVKKRAEFRRMVMTKL